MKRPSSSCIVCMFVVAGSWLAVSAHAQFLDYWTHWGRAGFEPGDFSFGADLDVAAGANGTVFVADQERNRILAFTDTGAFLTQWGAEGNGPGSFLVPKGVAVDPPGDVYVADAGNHRIQVFSGNGSFLREWGMLPAPVPGTGTGVPVDLDIDGQGNVYVALQQKYVDVFTTTGVALTRWGPWPEMSRDNYPPRIAADASGRLYVTDNLGCEVLVIGRDGTLLGRLGSFGTGPGQFNQIFGIASDRNGVIYIADRYNYRVQAWSEDGLYMGSFGSNGTGPGQFAFPYSMSAGLQGKVFVSDPYNYRITVFQRHVTPTTATSWGRLKALYR